MNYDELRCFCHAFYIFLPANTGYEVMSSGAAEAIVLRLGREFSQRKGDLGPITSGSDFCAIDALNEANIT